MGEAADFQSLRGRLLVATPGLVDENFFRTVVLLVAHTAEGAAGVVLNRPSETSVEEGPLEAWAEVAADPPLVFIGGPVAPTSAICLARAVADGRPEGWEPVVNGLGVVDLGWEPAKAREAVDRARLFAGYAGWASGQLEAEIEEGSWYVLEADPEDALSSEPGGLWRFVLRRQGGRLALVSSFPADPTMN